MWPTGSPDLYPYKSCMKSLEYESSMQSDMNLMAQSIVTCGVLLIYHTFLRKLVDRSLVVAGLSLKESSIVNSSFFSKLLLCATCLVSPLRIKGFIYKC
ncbi:hypothetical protein CEXT_234011 [Caerostris extrusa]|uniref:Uncharacterized protein n=1 Tax=Caerostris extrusa TaxID=172846 RepID=A0AAV4X1X8_CAEEX|nr:hypothetical protein CEXT_234011 [Caerostris extrusa]